MITQIFRTNDSIKDSLEENSRQYFSFNKMVFWKYSYDTYIKLFPLLVDDFIFPIKISLWSGLYADIYNRER